MRTFSGRSRTWACVAYSFGEIDHERLLNMVESRVSASGCVQVCWKQGSLPRRSRGLPRVISPLLANIYLHAFDRAWAEHGAGEVVRYADDFIVLCSTQQQAEEAQRRATAILGDLGLALHSTRPVWSTSGRASRALTFSGAIFTPACRASCGSGSTSSATTCTVGRLSGR